MYPRITKHIEEYSQDAAESNRYGMFGYMGLSVEIAIKKQDLEAIEKAVKLGWISPNISNAKQSMGTNGLIGYAKRYNADKSVEKLLELGFKP